MRQQTIANWEGLPPASRDDLIHDLLVAVFAVNVGMIDREPMVAALSDWVGAADRSLLEILIRSRAIDPAQVLWLEASAADVGMRLIGFDGETEDVPATLDPTSARRAEKQAETERKVGETPSLDPERSTEPMPAGMANPAGGPAFRRGSRFRLLRDHARGGLGKISIALDTELNREVVMKQILERIADDPNCRSRFELEAKITGGLEHPGIVPVYSLGCDDHGRPYYAMRFIRGTSLQDAVHAFHSDVAFQKGPWRRPLALRELLARFLNVCDAIEYAHSQGVIHRDLKPIHVMLGPYGETILVDWGVAKVVGQSLPEESTEPILKIEKQSGEHLTQIGQRIGTPAYMSPEQAGGRNAEIGPASDIYSLGATLYCMLTGHSPFQGYSQAEILRKVERGEFRPPRKVRNWIARPLEAICLKAMALKPADRYSSARALGDDIRQWLADEPVAAWPEPVSLRAVRWARRHRTIVAASVAGILVGLIVSGYALYLSSSYRQERRLAAEGRVSALGTAEVRALPRIVEELGPDLELIHPGLKSLADGDGSGSAQDDRRRFRGALALLPTEPSRAEFLQGYARRSEAGPDVILIVGDSLARHELVPQFAESFRRDFADPIGSDFTDGQLRSAGVLARLDPDDPIWEALAVRLARKLVLENPLRINDWREVFQPISGWLSGPLRSIFADPTQASRRDVAFTLLLEFADQPSNRRRPEDLAALLTQTGPAAAEPILAKLARPEDRDRAVGHLIPWLESVARFDEVRAARQGRAALALLRLGEPGPVLPLLTSRDDPSVRTELIHGAASHGIGPNWVIDRLRQESDPSARRACILCLGTYDPSTIPEAEKRSLIILLSKWYETERDAGLHGAIDWVLRRRWGQEDRMETLARSLASREPSAKLDWYVNAQGQTFTVVRGPVEFQMGSTQESDPQRRADERPHLKRISRSFAVAARELTVAEYSRFLDSKPAGVVDARSTTRFKMNIASADCPNAEANWFEMARYCNWLSEKEGLPDSEWCYPREIGPGMRLPDNFLDRTGYRMPTEAEWEYACRAGTASARPFGHGASRLREYSWYAADPDQSGKPQLDPDPSFMRTAGRKMPNDLGLFDMLGNAWEWCVNSFEEGENPQGPPPLEDRLPAFEVSEKKTRAIRGGAFNNDPGMLRSAARSSFSPDSGYYVIGMRLFRTIR